MFELNIDYVMIGGLGVFMAVAFYMLSKPSLDTIKEDEEERVKKMHHTPTPA